MNLAPKEMDTRLPVVGMCSFAKSDDSSTGIDGVLGGGGYGRERDQLGRRATETMV